MLLINLKILLTQSVCVFINCLQHNSQTTARMVAIFLGRIRTVSRKNWFKFGPDRVIILDSGEKMLQSLHSVRELLFFIVTFIIVRFSGI